MKLKTRVFLLHVVVVGLLLTAAAVGANWAFSRMVLGQFDQSLAELAETEAAAALANPGQPPRIHEMTPGTSAPSFPRLDKFFHSAHGVGDGV